MAEFILKDWYGKDCKFNHDTIFVQDANGNLVQFTQGKGNPTLEELEVTENGLYTPKGTVDGFNRVVVDVASEINEMLFNKTNFSGFASGDEFNGLHTKTLIVGTDIDSLKIIDGREYTVYWDDVNYTTYAKDTNYIIEEVVGGDTIYRSVYYLGNGSLLGLNGAEDTGEPFAIEYTQSKELLLVSTDTAESHSVAIMKRVRPRDGLEMMLQSLTVTENGEYTADSFYDGLKQVVVDVAGAGASDDVRYVTFMSHDGTIEYGKKAVAVGDDCADPIARGIFSTPTRESDAQYNYTHNGWSTEVNGLADSTWNEAITEDKTVYASFASAVRYYTITYYDSDGTTVLKTESLAYGSMPNYKPTKENYAFGGWTTEVVPVDADATYVAVWEEKVEFATASWDKIAEISESGKAKDYFKLGDEKIISYHVRYTGSSNKVTDYTIDVPFVIVHFGEHECEDGSEAGITLLSKHALTMEALGLQYYAAGNSHAISPENGWELSTARKACQDYIPNYLPSEVVEHIKAVKKLSHPSGNASVSSAPTETIDKLWFPSVTEYGVSYANTCAGQGFRFDHMTSIANRKAYDQGKSGIGTDYVKHGTRSTKPGSSVTFNIYIKTDGYSVDCAGCSYWRLGFCI